MGTEKYPQGELEVRANEAFLAGDPIKLSEDESIRGVYLCQLCLDTWRAGNRLDLVVRGGTIEGDLKFDYAKFGVALDFRDVKMGVLRLGRASFDVLLMSGCEVQRIEAAGLETTGSVDLNAHGTGKNRAGFVAHERVRLTASNIGGDLNCNHGTFGRSERDRELGWSALNVDGARVAGRFWLKSARAHGWVSAAGIQVGRELSCKGTTFANDQGGALNLKHANVGANGELSEIEAHGVVDLTSARFGEGVSLEGAQLRGDLRLRGCRAEGLLNLDRITVGPWSPDPKNEHAKAKDASAGEVSVRDAHVAAVSLQNAELAGKLDAGRLQVDRAFRLREITLSADSLKVDLRGLSVGTLDDCESAWPDNESHEVGGLSVGSVNEPEVDWRIRWLKANESWTPQPWQAIGGALQRDGHEAEARKLAIEREKYRSKNASLGRVTKLSRGIVHATVGYGYRPIYALGWAVAIVAVCAFVFSAGRLVADKGAPDQSAILYSIDTFVPVDLGYFNAYTPVGEDPLGALASVEAALGWLLAALLRRSAHRPPEARQTLRQAEVPLAGGRTWDVVILPCFDSRDRKAFLLAYAVRVGDVLPWQEVIRLCPPSPG